MSVHVMFRSRRTVVVFGLALAVVACSGGKTAPEVMGSADAGPEPIDVRPEPVDPADASLPSFGGGDAADDASPFTPVVDPPAPWCGPPPDPRPPIGGTLDCPDDKNVPGCGCAAVDEESSCWTGYRRNRGLGVCRDGRTKCLAGSDGLNRWGPCEGVVLPSPTATDPSNACTCFATGAWRVANKTPCVWSDGTSYWAYSTVPPSSGASNCTQANHLGSGVTPSEAWSSSTVRLDCAGKYTLCLRIRVGDFNAPKSSDCVMAESCVNVDYAEAHLEQATPDLPPWRSTDSACIRKWEVETPADASPGYYEMTASGQTYQCDAITKPPSAEALVIQRQPACAKICRDPSQQNNPVCVACR